MATVAAGRRFAGLLLGAGLALAGVAEAQLAQQPPAGGTGQPQRSPAPQQSAQSQPKAQSKAPSQPSRPSEPGTGSDAQLRQRVEQLEEQLVDMQVVIGTLESLGRNAGAASSSAAFRGGAPSGGLTGPDAGRLAALETQVQALTAQLEQMSDQLRALRGGASGAPMQGAVPARPADMAGVPRQGAAGPSSGGFATTVRPGGGDPIGDLISGGGPAPRQPQVASAGPSQSARAEYEAAYGLLLQRNYQGAQASFEEFLRRYPNDEMSANAQFWLGETFFVREQWDPAAAAFLKVAQSYGTSVKAPDSLAKLAMSLQRKGNNQAACRALAELNQRYPNPPQHVRTWEAAERRRAGCA